jgi:hypothetical protein
MGTSMVFNASSHRQLVRCRSAGIVKLDCEVAGAGRNAAFNQHIPMGTDPVVPKIVVSKHKYRVGQLLGSRATHGCSPFLESFVFNVLLKKGCTEATFSQGEGLFIDFVPDTDFDGISLIRSSGDYCHLR